MAAPLLNDYKRAFVYRRLLQTLLGGPRLALGCGVPCSLYALQVAVFLLPAILGCPLATLVDYDTLGIVPAMFLYGIFLGSSLMIGQLITYGLRGKGDMSGVDNENGELSEKASRLLAEDDEVDISQCCGSEVWEFVVPLKRSAASALVQAFIAGIVGAAGLWALIPSYTNYLYADPTMGAVTVALGWVVLCSAMYSLLATPPPEPAVFNAEERWDFAPFSRPVHIFLCLFSMGMIHWLGNGTWKQAETAVFSAFLFCPVLWLAGLLPPLEALVLWAAEQLLIIGFGGSPCASDWRLVLSLTLSVVSVLLLWGCCTGNPTWLLLMAAISAYVVSTDLGGIVSFLRRPITNRQAKYEAGDEEGTPAHSSLNRQVWLEVALHAVQILILSVMVGCVSADVPRLDTPSGLALTNWNETGNKTVITTPLREEDNGKTLTAICILLLVLFLISNELQKVFFIFGLVRNPLHGVGIAPSVTQIIRSVRGVMVYRCLPLFLSLYLTQLVSSDQVLNDIWKGTNQTLLLLNIMAVWRFLRSSWQNPEQTLLDVGMAWLLRLLFPCLSGVTECLQLLLASFVADRLHQAVGKAHFAMALAVAAVLPGASRRTLGFVLLVLNVVLLPIPLVVIAVASMLSAPLLPLFTLPFLLPSYPRPTRFWPSSGCQVAVGSAPDAVYYQQCASRIIDALHCASESGALGVVGAGSYFLLHFADRLIWACILEKGNGFAYYLLRGLELQETSCHAREAAGVEEHFSQAFGEDAPGVVVNKGWGQALTPLTRITVLTYSDARATLTGIRLGQADNSDLLAACLAWVLILHWSKNSDGNDTTMTLPEDADEVESPSLSPSLSPELRHAAPVWTPEWQLPSGMSSPTINTRANHLPPLRVGPRWAKDSAERRRQQVLERGDAATVPGSALGRGRDGWITLSSPLAPPSDWVPPSGTFSEMVELNHRWFHTIMEEAVKLGSAKQESEELGALRASWRRIVSACVRGLVGNRSSHDLLSWKGISRLFGADAAEASSRLLLPQCPASDWLLSHQDILSLALQAYQYAAKLSLDDAVLMQGGEHTQEGSGLGGRTEEQLAEELRGLEHEWFLGGEDGKGWAEAVLQEKPQLLSLKLGEGVSAVPMSRMLTLGEVEVAVGRLQREVVVGLWSSLSMELLYLTNDDDERYSIQALPSLLRNLAVQAADPPLGYPLYSSSMLRRPAALLLQWL